MNLDRIIRVGIRQLFRGSRRGQPMVAGLGAAMAIIGWLQRRSEAEQLVFKKNLAVGETVQVALLRNDEVVDQTAIEG